MASVNRSFDEAGRQVPEIVAFYSQALFVLTIEVITDFFMKFKEKSNSDTVLTSWLHRFENYGVGG